MWGFKYLLFVFFCYMVYAQNHFDKMKERWTIQRYIISVETFMGARVCVFRSVWKFSNLTKKIFDTQYLVFQPIFVSLITINVYTKQMQHIMFLHSFLFIICVYSVQAIKNEKNKTNKQTGYTLQICRF